ncbi:unnamed protein product [Protopolystoma xenopodis]|uniref:Uncharacterized protein n=1 Tax=Protopolystoma xenopodis TaxID=117903 RepID=A0A448XQK5_9PLAT|nr:unnamed protein product [Protopolystoma xenopodis]
MRSTTTAQAIQAKVSTKPSWPLAKVASEAIRSCGQFAEDKPALIGVEEEEEEEEEVKNGFNFQPKQK